MATLTVRMMVIPRMLVLITLVLASQTLSSGHISHVVGDDHRVGVEDDDRPRIYVVHVRRPDHMLSASPEEVEEWHKSFLPTATLDSGEPRLVFSYKEVISGFAARLTAEELRAMEAKEGFLHAQPDQELVHQTTYTPDFLRLRPGVWRTANRGDGVVIGVVDSGIDGNHTSFWGNPVFNLPTGWTGRCDFNRQQACNDKLLIAKDSYGLPPNDDIGHGTHVCGIAAGIEVPGANIHGYAPGKAAGAAPAAYIALYKATGDATILWGIEEAIKDGVDIISISMRTQVLAPPFHSSAIAMGALSAVRKGILVSCAGCNYGPKPNSICNDAPWLMTVGASTIGRALRLTLKLGDRDEIPGESLYDGAPFRRYLVFPGANGNRDTRACLTSLPAASVTGKVVMCYVGGSVEVKANVVRQAGGYAMVLMHFQLLGSIITDIPDLSIPTVIINHSNAKRLVDYVTNANHRPLVEFVPVGTVKETAPFPAVPYFSSRGPSLVNGGILKPDILGPGVNILAAKAYSYSEFTLKSGTSMATPHLSGVAAIMKSYQSQRSRISWTPAMIRSAIMTTSETANSWGGAITDETDGPASLFATGAGHVNPAGALDPGLVYNLNFDDYVMYLCGLGYSDNEVYRTAKVAVSCAQYRAIEPEQLNYPSISVTLASAARSVKIIVRTATSVLSRPSTYRAQVYLPGQRGVGVSVSPSTLNFAGLGEAQNFSVVFSLQAPAQPGQALQGRLRWVSNTHVVTSPLLVTLV